VQQGEKQRAWWRLALAKENPFAPKGDIVVVGKESIGKFVVDQAKLSCPLELV
jgi:hypothetical protein